MSILKEKIENGSLEPCPVCNGQHIVWGGYRYPELVCCDCGFKFHPENDFATEEEYYKEWNDLYEIGIDELIENQDKKIATINKLYKAANTSIEADIWKKVIDVCNDKKKHYAWTKKRMKEAERTLSPSAQ